LRHCEISDGSNSPTGVIDLAKLKMNQYWKVGEVAIFGDKLSESTCSLSLGKPRKTTRQPSINPPQHDVEDVDEA
jgi:hypothetical protein